MITGIVVALLLAVIVFQYMTIKIDKDKRHEAGHDKLTGLCAEFPGRELWAFSN